MIRIRFSGFPSQRTYRFGVGLGFRLFHNHESGQVCNQDRYAIRIVRMHRGKVDSLAVWYNCVLLPCAGSSPIVNRVPFGLVLFCANQHVRCLDSIGYHVSRLNSAAAARKHLETFFV